MLSKIEPMKREAKTIRKHKPLILNYFKAKKAFSSGIVEGLNNKVKLTMRKSYGFRTSKAIKIALYHNLGKLPESVGSREEPKLKELLFLNKSSFNF